MSGINYSLNDLPDLGNFNDDGYLMLISNSKEIPSSSHKVVAHKRPLIRAM